MQFRAGEFSFPMFGTAFTCVSHPFGAGNGPGGKFLRKRCKRSWRKSKSRKTRIGKPDIQAILRFHDPFDRCGELKPFVAMAAPGAIDQFTKELSGRLRFCNFQSEYAQYRHRIRAEDKTLNIGQWQIRHLYNNLVIQFGSGCLRIGRSFYSSIRHLLQILSFIYIIPIFSYRRSIDEKYSQCNLGCCISASSA